VLIGAFLLDANILATLALPEAVDPLNLPRFLSGHVLAVAGRGLFASSFILALQGVLLAILGERIFRKLSLVLQGLSITVLVMLLLLFPVLTGVVPGSSNPAVRTHCAFPHSGSWGSTNASWKGRLRCPSTPAWRESDA
jgi:hypothetical protein